MFLYFSVDAKIMVLLLYYHNPSKLYWPFQIKTVESTV